MSCTNCTENIETTNGSKGDCPSMIDQDNGENQQERTDLLEVLGYKFAYIKYCCAMLSCCIFTAFRTKCSGATCFFYTSKARATFRPALSLDQCELPSAQWLATFQLVTDTCANIGLAETVFQNFPMKFHLVVWNFFHFRFLIQEIHFCSARHSRFCA